MQNKTQKQKHYQTEATQHVHTCNATDRQPAGQTDRQKDRQTKRDGQDGQPNRLEHTDNRTDRRVNWSLTRSVEFPETIRKMYLRGEV